MDHSFYRSRSYWQQGGLDGRKEWSLFETGDYYGPRTFHESNTAIHVGGDCRGNLTLQNGGLLQIYGDLSATVEIGHMGEVILGGSLLPGAAIEADGIHHVFIQGDLSGSIRSRGSLAIWVCGSLAGDVRTGNPSTHLYVAGDVSGQITPLNGASLLFLDVDGFMPYEILRSIGAHGYTEFDASVGLSDQPPGIYPADRAERCYWTIHGTREATWNLPPDFGPHLSGE
jgi:cytoskeletal protein CcmA (bactofilin family)